MVIAIIGESCTGKSTLAEKLQRDTGATVYTGKDYLRLAKNAQEAENAFKALLANAVDGETVIYVISEKQHLQLLPRQAVRVLVTADLEIIKERFRGRMHGNLPNPVEAMLERNHGMFDNIDHHYRYTGDYEQLRMQIF